MRTITQPLPAALSLGYKTKVAGLVLLMLVGFIYALISASSFPLSLPDVIHLITGQAGNPIHQHIITSIRLPRALVAIFSGMGLAVSGLIMQSLTRNALASPSIFGVSAGAAFAFAFVSTGLVPVLGKVPILLVTFIGALTAGILVFFLAGLHHTKINPIRVVLAGVALNFIFISLTRAAVIFADEHAYGVLHWLTGSVANTGWKDVQLIVPVVVISLILSGYLAFQLNLLRLGEAMMQSVGGRLMLVRLLGSFIIVLLIAACVSAAGPIGFVGLMVPHISRYWVGHDIRKLIPITFLLGGNLVIYADVVSRFIKQGQESPVGIVTTLLGALFFLGLARHQVRKSL